MSVFSYQAAFLLAATSIFIPLLPIQTETQPVIAILVSALLFKNVINSYGSSLSNSLFFVCALIVVFYTIPSVYYYGAEAIVTAVKLLIPILFYLSIQKYRHKISSSVIFLFICVHYILLIIIYLGFGSFLVSIFGRASVGAGGELGSGVSYFAQEPGYAAMYLFAGFVSFYMNGDYKRKKILLLLTLALILLTKSFFGFVFVLLGLLMIYGRRGIVVSLALLTFILIFSPDGFRVGQIITTVVSIDRSDILYSLVLFEPSGATRLLKNIPAIYYGLQSIIGHGIGSFSSAFMEYAQGIALYEDHPLLSDAYFGIGSITPDSFYALIAFEMGLFSLPYLAAIVALLFNIYKRHGKKIALSGFAIFFLFTMQSQVSSPILLYCLYCLSNGSYCLLIKSAPRRTCVLLGGDRLQTSASN